MFNRKVFFEYARNAPLGGRLTSGQVQGLENILDYYETGPYRKDIRELAYILATVTWETGFKFQPLLEGGGLRYLKSKKYYPYIGTGLVQITWKANYDKYGLKVPKDGLAWDKAVYILFDGMHTGSFSGKKLSQYFNTFREDPIGARKIVNGTDKNILIARFWRNWLDALLKASEEFVPEEKVVIVEKTIEVKVDKDDNIQEVKTTETIETVKDPHSLPGAKKPIVSENEGALVE